ncbi:UDP-glucose 4-epimerase family protein [Pseudomonas sp. UBA4194]|uniref:UDP-glucose 4-epimerase family protein n=1 Tax=Pseudomonas sp. UBA4194 TaxID=1947317 RepID=UPI0025F79BE9|nr:SDR family oxidoreductase [Pseudomonas sp. UBA4194]
MPLTPVLVTGASGFVGGALVEHLLAVGYERVIAAVRRNDASFPSGAARCLVPELAADTSWQDALQGVDCVIHGAARVHVMKEAEADPLAAFRKVNVDGTLNLARQAAAAGVRRFIFISSVKVNGEGTENGKVYLADDVPAPEDAYGISKCEAEEGLRVLGKESGMEVVIIRPVLVYGAGVKANFRALLKLVDSGVPLPFAAARNRRSVVALDNLVDLITLCIEHPAAANQTFLASDGDALSTAELARQMAVALGKPVRQISVPIALMNLAAKALGRQVLTQRLFGSLEVSIAKNAELLGWQPPFTTAQALAATARHYQETRRS